MLYGIWLEHFFTDLGGVIEDAIFNNLGIDAVITAVIELDLSEYRSFVFCFDDI